MNIIEYFRHSSPLTRLVLVVLFVFGILLGYRLTPLLTASHAPQTQAPSASHH